MVILTTCSEMVVTEEDLAEARAVAETLTLEGVREVRRNFRRFYIRTL